MNTDSLNLHTHRPAAANRPGGVMVSAPYGGQWNVLPQNKNGAPEGHAVSLRLAPCLAAPTAYMGDKNCISVRSNHASSRYGYEETIKGIVSINTTNNVVSK